jgi:hypothetical protein
MGAAPKDNPDANQHHASADQDYAEIRKLKAAAASMAKRSCTTFIKIPQRRAAGA